MFDKILIANRGEIALRILRAAKELGIATVAVHSTADAEAMHVKLADEMRLHRPAAGARQLSEHPGAAVGLRDHRRRRAPSRLRLPLRERPLRRNPRPSTTSPSSARSAEHIRIMGDKIEAKRTAKRLGIPCVPGSDGGIDDDDEALRIADDIGFPVLVKAAAGGGGRGMKVARTHDDLVDALATRAHAKPRRPSATTRSISKNIWRSRGISRSRFSATASGSAIHLGERDCSLQRRHQKVWEEGPSPALNRRAARARSATSCAQAMRELGYIGAGTIEFLYEDGEFYFIEMNTRIQVEHPVTEMITGLDLVNEQIRIAAGAAAVGRAGRREFLGPRDRMPRQCREPRDLPAVAGKGRLFPSARRRLACASIPRSTRAMRSRRTTIRWSAS